MPTAILMLLALVLQAPTKVTLAGATNVTRVDAVVMCGGSTLDGAFPALKSEGFVSVINLRRADENGVDLDASRSAAEAAGLRYIHLPVNPSAIDDATVDRFLKAVTDKANQPIYLHCASANRVGAMWLIKRVVVDGWDVERATTEANAIGLTSEPLRQFAVDYAARHKK